MSEIKSRNRQQFFVKKNQNRIHVYHFEWYSRMSFPSISQTLTLTEFFIGWRKIIFCFCRRKKKPKNTGKTPPQWSTGRMMEIKSIFSIFLCITQMPEIVHKGRHDQMRKENKHRKGSGGDFHRDWVWVESRFMVSFQCLTQRSLYEKNAFIATVKNVYPWKSCGWYLSLW